jgi:hypothetical protein
MYSVVHRNCVTKPLISQPTIVGYSRFPQPIYLNNSWRGLVDHGMKLARFPIGRALVQGSQMNGRHQSLSVQMTATLIVDDLPS